MQRLPLIFRRRNVKIKKKKNRKNDEVSSDDRREMKFKRTLSVLIAFSWWSKRSFHVLSLPPFYRIEKRDTSVEKREKKKEERKKETERERKRKGRHVPVNFHLSQPCLVLKSFECTVAIRLRRFPSYFLSGNLVKERGIIHACAYIYIYIYTFAKAYLPKKKNTNQRRTAIYTEKKGWGGGGGGREQGDKKRRSPRCRRVATRVAADEFQKLKWARGRGRGCEDSFLKSGKGKRRRWESRRGWRVASSGNKSEREGEGKKKKKTKKRVHLSSQLLGCTVCILSSSAQGI